MENPIRLSCIVCLHFLHNLRPNKTTMMNPNRKPIKGVICGVRVETIEDPLMREIRYPDKLIDELAKGKPLEKILRKEL